MSTLLVDSTVLSKAVPIHSLEQFLPSSSAKFYEKIQQRKLEYDINTRKNGEEIKSYENG